MGVVDEMLKDFAELPDPPLIARVEVGSAVYQWLRSMAVPRPENPYLPRLALASFFGVPLAVDESMEPTAWRLLDRDGEIIKEGRRAVKDI